MDQAKELLEMPREFLKDGRGFITRCSKRASFHHSHSPSHTHTHTATLTITFNALATLALADFQGGIADKREFLRISQAVGMGFLIMGVIGYVVKLSMLKPSDHIGGVEWVLVGMEKLMRY